MFGFARKWLAYHVKDYIDPLAIRHLKEVGNVREQHGAELEYFWRLTSPDGCASLVVAFLEELRHEWPREYKELNPEGLPDAVSEGFRGSIKQAYVLGCMMGKGWVSKEHLSDFNIYLGDKLARDVRSVLKGAKSKGIAFASGYTVVSTLGQLKVLQKKEEKSNLKEVESEVKDGIVPKTTPDIAKTITEIEEYDQQLLAVIDRLRKDVSNEEDMSKDFMRSHGAPEKIIENLAQKARNENSPISFYGFSHAPFQIQSFLVKMAPIYKTCTAPLLVKP